MMKINNEHLMMLGLVLVVALVAVMSLTFNKPSFENHAGLATKSFAVEKQVVSFQLSELDEEQLHAEYEFKPITEVGTEETEYVLISKKTGDILESAGASTKCKVSGCAYSYLCGASTCSTSGCVTNSAGDCTSPSCSGCSSCGSASCSKSSSIHIILHQ